MFCVILVFDIELDERKQSSEGTFADFPNAPPHKIDLIEGVVATNFPQQLSSLTAIPDTQWGWYICLHLP